MANILSKTNPTPKPDFAPVCLGCNYDLAGLANGKCPECGDEFTAAGLYEKELERRSVAEDRARRIARKAWNWSVILAIAVYFFGAGLEFPLVNSPSAPWIFLLVWVSLLLAWMTWGNPDWKSEAPRILLFLIPLCGFLAVTLRSPYRSSSIPPLLVAAAALCLVSLRIAPWRSARMIAILSAPFLIGGIGVCLHAAARNPGWSELDLWTGDRWVPKTGAQALEFGWTMVGIAAGFTLFSVLAAAFFARAKPHLQLEPGAPSKPT